jgi:glyoxylase-like metal-dependent hydrolase (beta-lactamase superfamily II)
MADWTELADGLLFKHYGSLSLNIGALQCGDGVLLIDTRAHHGQARELASDLRRITRSPVRWVVNTHHHWDHTFGNSVFLPAAIWGHVRCAEALRDRGEAMRRRLIEWSPDHAAAFEEVEIVPPDHTFATEATVTFEGREVRLRHLGRGHTDNDIVVVVPDAGVVFAGDLIEQGAPPAFQDSFPLEWPDAVERLSGEIAGPVVPGHGWMVDRAFVAAQQADLAEVARLAAERHAEGMPIADAAAAGGPFPEEALRDAFTRAWPSLEVGG